MTAIPLKRIEGCLVENERLIDPRRNLTPFQIKYLEEVNIVIQRQGEVKITLNREKSIKKILKLWTQYDRLNVQKDSGEEAGDIIDAILNALPELVEVVK